MTLEGKVAIVTGVTKPKGAGRAIAQRLAEQGAAVAITGRAKSLPARRRSPRARSEGHRDGCCRRLDRRRPDRCRRRRSSRSAPWTCSSTTPASSSARRSSRQRGPALGRQLGGQRQGCGRASSRRGRTWKRRGGSIVNIASLAGIGANSGMPYPYTAPKFAWSASPSRWHSKAARRASANVVSPGRSTPTCSSRPTPRSPRPRVSPGGGGSARERHDPARAPVGADRDRRRRRRLAGPYAPT